MCDREQYWAGVCDVAHNPYAYFFDTDDEKQASSDRPFMFWDHFYMDIGASSSGRGKLLVMDFVPGSGTEFDWLQDP